MPFKIRDIIEIRSSNAIENFVRITRVSRFNITVREASTIAASGGTLGPTTVDQLNPPKSELLEITGAGFDCGAGYLQLVLRQPSSVVQLGTSRAPTAGIITSQDSPRNAPLALSLFSVYERQPASEWSNQHDQGLRPSTRWIGWRYEIEIMSREEIKSVLEQKLPYSTITIGGFRS